MVDGEEKGGRLLLDVDWFRSVLVSFGGMVYKDWTNMVRLSLFAKDALSYSIL